MKKHCPDCGTNRAYLLGDGRWKCQRCGKRYRLASAWDMSRLSETTKRVLLERFALGVPVYRQRFRVTVSMAAIERFYRIIRACCAHVEELRAPLEGEIECDETTFGGYRRGGKPGWTGENKIVVFGLVKRNGQVRAFPLPSRSGKRIIGLIREHTTAGSLYYTDEWRAYVWLRTFGKHVRVRKDKSGRPKGRGHINGIEGFWSYAKNWLYPLRGVPQQYFHLYLAEICYRFNHRKRDLVPELTALLKSIPREKIDQLLVQIG